MDSDLKVAPILTIVFWSLSRWSPITRNALSYILSSSIDWRTRAKQPGRKLPSLDMYSIRIRFKKSSFHDLSDLFLFCRLHFSTIQSGLPDFDDFREIHLCGSFRIRGVFRVAVVRHTCVVIVHKELRNSP